MISTVLRRSVLGTSRRTLAASVTSINAVLFHHLTPATATANGVTNVKLLPPTSGRDMIGRARTGTGKTLAADSYGRASFTGPLVTKEAAEGTKICIAIRSLDNPEKQAWCLPPHTRKVAMPTTRTLYTVLRSPHVDKKSREQFEMRFQKRFLVIKAQSDELSKKLFWLKRYRILGAQYELQFHCKTRLDMTHVFDGSTKGQ